MSDDHQARTARPWRVLFVLYALALTTGTHWPRLELRVGDMPAPDKVLHMLGFGGLAFLLWRTRWLGLHRGAWPLAIVVMAWAVLDEVTQAIPILGRSFSWMDVVGGWLGIVLVLVWIWAIGPIGGPAACARYERTERVIDELFLRGRTWTFMGAAGVLGTAAFGVPMALYVNAINPRATLAGFFAAGLIGGAMASIGMLATLTRRQRAAAPLPRAVWRQALWHATATFLGGAGLLVALYRLAFLAGLHEPWGMILLDVSSEPVQRRVPLDLRLAIDLTLFGMLLAVSVRICRETLTRAVDTLCSDG